MSEQHAVSELKVKRGIEALNSHLPKTTLMYSQGAATILRNTIVRRFIILRTKDGLYETQEHVFNMPDCPVPVLRMLKDRFKTAEEAKDSLESFELALEFNGGSMFSRESFEYTPLNDTISTNNSASVYINSTEPLNNLVTDEFITQTIPAGLHVFVICDEYNIIQVKEANGFNLTGPSHSLLTPAVKSWVEEIMGFQNAKALVCEGFINEDGLMITDASIIGLLDISLETKEERHSVLMNSPQLFNDKVTYAKTLSVGSTTSDFAVSKRRDSFFEITAPASVLVEPQILHADFSGKAYIIQCNNNKLLAETDDDALVECFYPSKSAAKECYDYCISGSGGVIFM